MFATKRVFKFEQLYCGAPNTSVTIMYILYTFTPRACYLATHILALPSILHWYRPFITSYGHSVTSYRHSPVTWTSDPTLRCHLSNLALLSLSHSIHILSLCTPLTPTPLLLHSILTFFCSESIHQACIHTGCVGEGKYVHSVVCEMSHSLDYHWSAVETISNHSPIGPLHLVLQRPISTDGRWGPAHRHIRGRGHLETGIGRSTWAGWAGVVGRSMLCWNGG